MFHIRWCSSTDYVKDTTCGKSVKIPIDNEKYFMQTCLVTLIKYQYLSPRGQPMS